VHACYVLGIVTVFPYLLFKADQRQHELDYQSKSRLKSLEHITILLFVYHLFKYAFITYLIEKIAAPVQKTENTDVGIR
jgi:uncharacterized membrane protein